MARKQRSSIWTLLIASVLLGCNSRQVAVDPGPDTIAVADLTVDSAAGDGAAGDTTGSDAWQDAGASDMNLTFPAVLEGVWLIGWSGGMNHFSWVRFAKMASPTMTKKDAWILDGKAILTNQPLWSCNGKASYWMGAAASTIYLDFPSTTCLAGGVTTAGYIFSNFDSSGAGAPKDAILSATVKVQSTLEQFSGYKYPDTWCDAVMTNCKAPW